MGVIKGSAVLFMYRLHGWRTTLALVLLVVVDWDVLLLQSVATGLEPFSFLMVLRHRSAGVLVIVLFVSFFLYTRPQVWSSTHAYSYLHSIQ